MRARPKQENYYTKDPESNENAMFLDRYVDDWGKWADEAEVSLNAGDYLIAKQKQEIKELKEGIQFAYDVAQGAYHWPHEDIIRKLASYLKH